jgi:hypothetical protein
MRSPETFIEEQERRRKLLAAAAKGDVKAQKKLQTEYSVRILSAAERAKLEYVQTKPDKLPRYW